MAEYLPSATLKPLKTAAALVSLYLKPTLRRVVMKIRELSNELSMSVRNQATKLASWLGHADWFDFKASPAFGAGDAKINNGSDTDEGR